MALPVIDLFAGPGGLGEGFSALRRDGENAFQMCLSIEKDEQAHQTLQLRAFFRQFPDGKAPDAYYDYLAGIISRSELFEDFPTEAQRADREAWHAELGGDKFPPKLVDQRIWYARRSRSEWVLIGGPPCQAYSLVGRSRRTNDPNFAADEKHFLYKQYLRILAVHQPPVFIMENVKGLLSAKVQENSILERILTDLENPVDAVSGPKPGRKPVRYHLMSLVSRKGDLFGRCEPGDFVVRAEDYGVPQTRHRIIILGVLADNGARPGLLERQPRVSIEEVISDLPRLRSGLSKEFDGAEEWRNAIADIGRSEWLRDTKVDEALRQKIRSLLREFDGNLTRGLDFGPRARRSIRQRRDWFGDKRLGGVCNHTTRSHIRADLHRYFFAAVFAQVHGRSPLLNDMPDEILPLHQNVEDALDETKFSDRFRVQLAGRPATTVTSHIAKDGHYYIHYDPLQCRSLTVREAARLQTFPDNYFFEGPRTEQYKQVGNAVPPLLARQIANIVFDLLRRT